MEIGTEISKKIRAAIKGKLQELGAYIDEELPDYIMVMVANKKTSQQMSDDLSLFLGNNTYKFTVWLQGVLEKLRSVAVEPASLSGNPIESESDASAGVDRSSASEDGRAEELKLLTVSSSRSDRTEARVSSSAHETRRGSLEKSSSRLTSAVRPLMEPLPLDAVLDIKPEMDDDDLIAEDSVEMGTNHGRSRGSASRPTAEIYRPGQSKFTSLSSAETCRSSEGSSHSRQQDGRSSRASRTGSSRQQDELSRKRKAPVATKQANRNLILKAISEAQDSITRTTSYPSIAQRKTVPVAPRTRMASSEDMTAAIQLVQEHLHSLNPRAQTYTSADLPSSRSTAPVRTLASRLQLDLAESDERGQGDYVSRPQLGESSTKSQLPPHVKGDLQSAVPRTVQASKDSASPKFIVTLDGVPSPLGNLAECEMELDYVRPPSKVAEATAHVNRDSKVSIHQRLQGRVASPEDDMMEVEMAEEGAVSLKKRKVTERCRFWPVCKSGDECLYHHPTTQCKTFPSCKFGDKCLFVHPNCKYDARCTKPDCPFTHVSRRSTAAPPPRPAVQPVQTASVCRFFPECKKMDCPFYHPKACRFAAQCKRTGCTFYHPTSALPPRHAMKWTKAQSS
ncbi:Zinc finger CCCH domain-containing protein 14 [Liparis tanakae]|uniref:Zinc finger CCCH domain-containing protein 14 n=1 Tax=Liparis tanakae TaxID=230148 RepID=A0A4Z2IZC3_9TELE|nr:Zinc finger CCCH domain-containing protein 14 [Liparis tanakae]